jgi:multidrug transporter EmrE-like cation transporter
VNERLLGLLYVTLAVLFEAFGQLAFKHSAESAQAHDGTFGLLRRLWYRKSMALGILCFGADAVFWTLALRVLDVSLAFPVSSLGFVFVVVLSHVWLREEVSAERWIGVSLILAGVVLTGLS